MLPQWRAVLHTPEWHRVDHGLYRHDDGRTVRYNGVGGFVRWAADGARLTARCRVESWEEIRGWAIS